ncbi:bifunctional NUDIX hydrolase/histidine phosphatase family protein [Rhodococcus sp. ARC_M6]|uniref:bifunctional NUDIX hydrolase/histidine phosphatase family protein n=1 Tax=Rhodococcus sp. ARC_M6 TaxID=2928852 RepID=UPI001FB303D6|nr:bifunctional NUDIX hydrolase/histidine phosphatase family protein [Rhodococcus sp. ARC_M6]MCJ0904882.1 NUDIX hydrolase [Rhodococcus sp. ARC_M6]
MTDKPVKANIFAAGAVLWRKALDNPQSIEIAVIHRPKYDDWSFPKGKLDPGETFLTAAVREVQEETSMSVRLGRHLGGVTYPIPGHRKLKRVEYWAAEAVGGEFGANSEVDVLHWLPIDEVPDHLSYPMDRMILRRFVAVPTDTRTVLLVRHAKAGSRKRYNGDDTLRPLDATGKEQAAALVGQLRLFGADSVYSADRTRCIDTVLPLAEALGVEVVTEPLLSEEGYDADPAAARARILEIASSGGTPVICSQGGVIPDLMAWWSKSAGVTLPSARNRKASTWVLSFVDDQLVAADHLDSPLPKVANA